MMRRLALLCIPIIFMACSKDEEPAQEITRLSLPEQVEQSTSNTLFAEALACADYDLSQEQLTLFVPSEKALTAFLNDVGATSFESFKNQIGSAYYKAWIGAHLLPESARLENLHTAFIPSKGSNSEGQPIYMHLWRNKSVIRLNGQWIDILERDKSISNGIIHEIDQVLNPATLTKLVRAHQQSFSILERALRITNLAPILNNDQKKFTLLAPNDQAFDQYFQDKECGDLDGFIAEYGIAELKRLIEGHMLNGAHYVNDLKGSSLNSNASNAGLSIYLDNGLLRVQRTGVNGGKSAHILINDISCFNGSLNIIDEVLKLP